MKRNIRATACSGLLATIQAVVFYAPLPSFAQEADTIEELVVTGSRIKRDQFSSAAPIQVMIVDEARQIGVSSLTEMLHRSTMTNGQQVDTTINTSSGNSNATEAPVFGGIGSANVGLRNLGPERTLIMVNSRRMGSAGVRGAPAQPDINLLPMNLVESVDVVTEGASSVYGADAVAGVVNINLRESFEGFEFSVNTNQPFDDGGEVAQFSFITGASNDRSRFVFSGEYHDQKRVKLGDREDCYRDRPQLENGDILERCRNIFPDNIVASLDTLFDGDETTDFFLFYTPGVSAGDSNIGVADWQLPLALPQPTGPNQADESVSGEQRFTYIPYYNDSDERLNADLVTPVKRFSLVSLGGYSPEWFGGGEEIYYEAFYFNRRTFNRAANEQIFPSIPMDIPQEDVDGNIITGPDGLPVLVDNPLNPFNSTDWVFDPSVVVTLDDLPQERDVEVEQFRFVGGMRGDIAGGWFGNNDWSYDVYGSYDRGIGFQEQQVLNETNLHISMETLRLDADGNPICGLTERTNLLGLLTPAPCAVVNFFAPSIFTGGPNGEGEFSTQEEKDWLITSRLNRTVVTQAMFAAYATGDVFELPGGMAAIALGGEYRRDTIDSSVETLGQSGAVVAETAQTEGKTRGSRDIVDFYFEISAPLLADMPGIDYLELEAAVRHTDESNFGNKTTYRGRVTYQPIDWITASASIGTSFRAPNLREQFLSDQFTGVNNAADPCSIPDAANIGGVYFPNLDTRSQTVIDNCVLSGADPTVLGLGAGTTIPVRIGGNVDDLDPETSDSFTASLLFSPPISDDVAVDIGFTYFDFEVKDTVRQLNASTIMERCYNDAPGLSSPFCSRLTRDMSGAIPDTLNFISLVDASFINLGKETSKGFDINLRLQMLLNWFGGTDLQWSNHFTHQLEADEQIFEDDIVEDKVGTFGTPENQYTTTIGLLRGRWELLVAGRYIDSTVAGLAGSLSADPSCGEFATFLSLAGAPLASADCKAGSRWYWDSSITYRHDETLTFTAGITNIGDTEPGRVQSNDGPGSERGTRVVSSGYDQYGRSWFLNLTKSF